MYISAILFQSVPLSPSPDGSAGKESACNVVQSWVRSLGWKDSPGEGNGYPLQYSGLENAMDRGAWWATVHGVVESWTRLSDWQSMGQTHVTLGN